MINLVKLKTQVRENFCYKINSNNKFRANWIASSKITGLISKPPKFGTTDRIQSSKGSCNLDSPVYKERTIGCHGLIILKATSQLNTTYAISVKQYKSTMLLIKLRTEFIRLYISFTMLCLQVLSKICFARYYHIQTQLKAENRMGIKMSHVN